jgi:hypothetical protein
MSDRLPDIFDRVATRTLVQLSIEVLGDAPELDNQVIAEVQRKGLPALFTPKPDQPVLVASHNDPGVGSTYKAAAIA